MLKTLMILCVLSMISACGDDDSGEVHPAEVPDEEAGLAKEVMIGMPGDKGDKGEVGPMGPAGPTGATGPQGATGATGPAGAQGQAGAKGDDGADGQTVSGTMWYDPIEDRYWTMGSKMPYTVNACGPGWRIPTYIEVRTAVARGLLHAARQLDVTIDKIWVSDVLPSGNQGFYSYPYDGLSGGLLADKNSYFCIEE